VTDFQKSKLAKVLEDVQRATEAYADKHDGSAVLIFDHVDELSSTALATLQKDLLQKAKDKTVIPVLVCSKPEIVKAAEGI